MSDTDTITEIVSSFVAAIADDGKIDAEEAADLLNDLSRLVPAEGLLAQAGELIEDALYRDSAELRAAADRKLARAADARADGKASKAERLEARAAELDAKAAERD